MGGNTKQDILRVALRLFSERGYDGVSVRHIATEVGIKEGSIYNHYAGKGDIFDSVLNYCIDFREKLCLSPEEIEELAKTKTAEVALKRLAFRFIESEKAQIISLAKILFREQYNNPRAAKEYYNFLDDIEDELRLMLKRLMEHDKIAPCNLDVVPKTLAYLLFLSLNNATHGRFEDFKETRDISKTKSPFDYVLYQILSNRI